MRPKLPITASCFLACAASAHSQSLLYEEYGKGFDDQLGYAVAGGADFDQDGWDDVVLGAPFVDRPGAPDAGAVRVISGRTGAVLMKRSGDGADDHLGWSVAAAGDVDGDGWPDVIAGAPNAWDGTARTGMARVWSGRTGKQLFTLYGSANGDEFGHSVGGGLDWDADGVGDVVVGSPNGATAIGRPGYARVATGPSGLQVWTTTTSTNLARHGAAVCGEGDFDGDGTNDLAVGAPGGGAGKGEVYVMDVYSKVTMALPVGVATGDEFGAALAALPDTDGDGRDELLIGAPGHLGSTGSVHLHGGTSLFPLHVWDGELPLERFGTSVSACGDLDGDGGSDLLIGVPQEWTGARGNARVFASLGARPELLRLEGEPGSRFGRSVSTAGDFNQDGAPDLVVGAHTAFDSSQPSFAAPGLARVHSGGAPGFVSFCTAGVSASGCQAQLSGLGLPSASAPSGFMLQASGVEGSKPGIFFFGKNGRQAQPWGNGTSFLCVTPPAKRGGLLPSTGTNGSCDGAFFQDLNAHWCASCPKPHHSPGAGAVVQAQLWYRDPLNTSNQSTSLSDALEFVLAP